MTAKKIFNPTEWSVPTALAWAAIVLISGAVWAVASDRGSIVSKVEQNAKRVEAVEVSVKDHQKDVANALAELRAERQAQFDKMYSILKEINERSIRTDEAVKNIKETVKQ